MIHFIRHDHTAHFNSVFDLFELDELDLKCYDLIVNENENEYNKYNNNIIDDYGNRKRNKTIIMTITMITFEPNQRSEGHAAMAQHNLSRNKRWLNDLIRKRKDRVYGKWKYKGFKLT